jgi:hypothetical protein
MKFDAAQIAVLRNEMAKINRIDPLSPTYRRMIKLIDGMPVEQLKQMRDAKIKFLSSLALNRLPH